MRARLHVASIALLAIAGLAYAGVLLEARNARSSNVDTVVYGARLAADGGSATNSAFDARNGSAAIGINYRLSSSAGWTIVPLPEPASSKQWIVITAEAPQFFAADGNVRIYAGALLIGAIHARSTNGGNEFSAEPEPQSIFVPPEQTFGYRFDLGNGRRCTAAICRITVLGSEMFWHIFRITVIGETEHLAKSQAPQG